MDLTGYDYGPIELARAYELERQIRAEIDDQFYAGNRMARLKRRFCLKTFPPHFNVTVFRAKRDGQRLFIARRIDSGHREPDEVSVKMNIVGEVVDVVFTNRGRVPKSGVGGRPAGRSDRHESGGGWPGGGHRSDFR